MIKSSKNKTQIAKYRQPADNELEKNAINRIKAHPFNYKESCSIIIYILNNIYVIVLYVFKSISLN